MMAGRQDHIPVMLDEVVTALAPQDGDVIVDGTFGAGGYSRALLDAADCRVIAIDRDAQAVRVADEFRTAYGERFTFVRGCFGDADQLIEEAVDGFVLDIGVSSMQLDQGDRGFSFRFDGPLDMRMDQHADIPTAADIVNNYDEKDLADLIYHYGEERHSRRVARAIVEARSIAPIETTGALADIVRAVVHKSPKDKTDQATRTFQALRIAVNEELEELQSGLEAAERLLKAGGRLVVVTFHSLEDKIVKRFLRERAGKESRSSRHLPETGLPQAAPTFSLPSGKAILPSAAESAANPRSRSAKLRVAIRTTAQPWATSSGNRAGGRG